MFWMQDSRRFFHKLPETILPKLENMRLQVSHCLITFITSWVSLRMVSSKWDPMALWTFLCVMKVPFLSAFSHESFAPIKYMRSRCFFRRKKVVSKGPRIYVPWLQQDQRTYGYRCIFLANRSSKLYVKRFFCFASQISCGKWRFRSGYPKDENLLVLTKWAGSTPQGMFSLLSTITQHQKRCFEHP